VRQCEVARGTDLLLSEIDAVDSEEVGVEVFLVVEDPEDFLDPIEDGLGQVRAPESLVQNPRPCWRPYAFPSCFSRRPIDRSTTIWMMRRSCSSFSPLDFSSAS